MIRTIVLVKWISGGSVSTNELPFFLLVGSLDDCMPVCLFIAVVLGFLVNWLSSGSYLAPQTHSAYTWWECHWPSKRMIIAHRAHCAVAVALLLLAEITERVVCANSTLAREYICISLYRMMLRCSVLLILVARAAHSHFPVKNIHLASHTHRLKNK